MAKEVFFPEPCAALLDQPPGSYSVNKRSRDCVENSGRTVQYKLNAQSVRHFGLHRNKNDAHRASANRLQNKKRPQHGNLFFEKKNTNTQFRI